MRWTRTTRASFVLQQRGEIFPWKVAFELELLSDIGSSRRR